MSIIVETVTPLVAQLHTELQALRLLREEWEELLENSAQNEITFSPLWLLTWYELYGAGLAALEFRAEGRLVGLIPLRRRLMRHRGIIPLRRLEALGSGEPEEDAVCSEYLGAPVRRGYESHVAEALAHQLIQSAFGPWDELILPKLADDQEMTALLEDAFRRVGLRVVRQTTGVAPFVPLPENWEAYLKSLSGAHRKFVRQTMRDFEAWAGDDYQITWARTAEELVRGQAILIDLHHQRWEEHGEKAGVFRSERFLRFHRSVMPQLLERGELALAWLTVAGRPIAAVYCLMRGGKVSYYQCGRTLDAPARVRPGIVLVLLVLRHFIATGQREFDFLSGGQRYKQQLSPASRSVVDLRVVRPSWRSQVCWMFEWAVERSRPVRKWVRDYASRIGVVGSTLAAADSRSDTSRRPSACKRRKCSSV